MKFYPVLLNLQKKRCIVVGGGKVAQRKVLSLVKAGADVCIVSNTLSPQLKKLVRTGKVAYEKSEYRKKFLRGVFLAISATDDREVNARVYEDAQQKGVFVNCVDDPLRSNFIVPAVCRKGDVTVAFSTGGTAPGFARQMKTEIAGIAGGYRTRLDIIKKVRARIKTMYPSEERKKIILRLSAMSFGELKKNTLVRELLK